MDPQLWLATLSVISLLVKALFDLGSIKRELKSFAVVQLSEVDRVTELTRRVRVLEDKVA